MSPNASLPLHRRALTRADGSINFRFCLGIAREFADARRRRQGWPAGRPLALAERRAILDRVAELVEHENAAWAALTPAVRAAANHFDAMMDVLGTECICVVSRREAVEALVAGRPTVWDTYRHSPKNPFTSLLNGGVGRQIYEGSHATVFEALVTRSIGRGDEVLTSTLTALNPEGARLISLVTAACDARRRPVAVAA